MNPELHAIDMHYSLEGNGYVNFKAFVVKKISTLNLKSKPVYVIRTALKVSIYNTQDFNIAPGAVTAFMNYPAIFNFKKSLTCLAASEVGNFKLLTYSPITVNSSINTSRSDSTGKVLTNSSQQSVGSSSSQTNSFGVNVQAGLMMELPMWSVGLSYDHAYTSGQNQERSTVAGNSAEQQMSNVDSFSIKDWGIYSKVNREALEASWICAQEYPWDVLQFRNAKGDGAIELPQPIIDRMLVGNCVLPPSQLSLFGTDFTFSAEWSFTPSDENVDMDAELLSIGVNTSYVLASHQRTGSSEPYGLAPSFAQPAFDSNALKLTWWQLECLALNPIVPGRNDASLNLDKLPTSRFPTKAGIPLTVDSPTHTLLCVAKGFAPGMIADVAKASASYKLAFKVAETVGEVSLYLKHWKLDEAGLVLNIEINDVPLPAQYVDALQGEGGTGNRLTIMLRSTDYMAEDFCDYLKVGLNVINITVSVKPSSSPSVARYCVAGVVVT
jgi:hypothetical protein